MKKCVCQLCGGWRCKSAGPGCVHKVVKRLVFRALNMLRCSMVRRGRWGSLQQDQGTGGLPSCRALCGPDVFPASSPLVCLRQSLLSSRIPHMRVSRKLLGRKITKIQALLVQIRPFFASIPKAKTAKIGAPRHCLPLPRSFLESRFACGR